MSETADKNTFAGALAQESSHYVTLSNCTIAAISCQQVFSMFLKFFDTLVICLTPHADFGYPPKFSEAPPHSFPECAQRHLRWKYG